MTLVASAALSHLGTNNNPNWPLFLSKIWVGLHKEGMGVAYMAHPRHNPLQVYNIAVHVSHQHPFVPRVKQSPELSIYLVVDDTRREWTQKTKAYGACMRCTTPTWSSIHLFISILPLSFAICWYLSGLSNSLSSLNPIPTCSNPLKYVDLGQCFQIYMIIRQALCFLPLYILI